MPVDIIRKAKARLEMAPLRLELYEHRHRQLRGLPEARTILRSQAVAVGTCAATDWSLRGYGEEAGVRRRVGGSRRWPRHRRDR